MQPVITIVDYGMGNIGSLRNALDYLGAHCRVSEDPTEVAGAEALILPGVGSFRLAATALRERGLDDAIREAVIAKGRSILGICLGMQLLGLQSPEDGETEGLGLIGTAVARFSEAETHNRKIPHIGFNIVNSAAESRLFAGLNRATDFYFVHSYRLLPVGLSGLTATCVYGVEFLAAYEHEQIFATQFHPEKSQTSGLRLLKNFLMS